MSRTGAFAYVKYGWEGSFKSGASTRNIVFGRNVRITTERRENPELIYELGDRPAQDSAFKRFEGAVRLEWVLSNPWFFKGLLGSVSSSGTGPYTHTYTYTKTPVSLEIEDAFQASAANVVRLLRGCVFNSVTISGGIDELLRCRADLLYADEATGTLGSALVDTFPPYTFAHMTLELPSGTVLAQVQRLELTISNETALVYGLGDHKAVDSVWRAFNAVGRFSITMKNSTFLGYLRGEQPSIKIKITNGLTGTSEKSITINGSGVVFGEHSVDKEANEIVVEDLPIAIRKIDSVVAVNNNSHP